MTIASLARPLLVAGSLLLAGAAGAQQRNELPDIGTPANTTLSMADERKIGLMVMRSLRESGQIVEDPEATEYLQSVGAKLASEAHEGGHQFTFFLVKDNGINAFALPGGYIGINAGLLTATATESELAGVLAHEIAHVTQRHIARSVQAGGRSSLASAAAILAAVILSATTGMPSDALMGTVAAAQGLAAQQQINFTRANESEADRVGMQILSRAGFDPRGMPAFFWTLQQRSGGAGAQVPEMLLTHPVTSDRISETRARAELLPPQQQPDSLGYALARERVRVAMMPGDADFESLYPDAASADMPSSDARRYGRALALVRGRKPEAALPILRELIEKEPGVTLYRSALGEAQLAADDVDGARATLEAALALFPRSVPVTIRYAEVLMRVGDHSKAHAVLLDLFNTVYPTPQQARLIALAASSAGDTGDAYYYMSEYHVMGGDLQLAIDQLRLALAAPNLNDVQRNRFRARLEELTEYLPKGKRAREVAEPATQTEGKPG